MILDIHISTGAKRESEVYLERITLLKKRFPIILEVFADRGYGSGDI